jgi:hypothetical protein
MWIRTINGWEFFEVTYTSQGIPIIKIKIVRWRNGSCKSSAL